MVENSMLCRGSPAARSVAVRFQQQHGHFCTAQIIAHRCSRRHAVRPTCYQSATDAQALLGVNCMTPNSNLSLTESAITTLGQAFMGNSLHREVKTRPGKEQDVFGGISRIMLDTHGNDPVLFTSEAGPAHAAAVLLTNTQAARTCSDLVELDFSVIPGTHQMLQAVPQSSIAVVTDAMEAMHKAGQDAMQAVGHSKYLKVMLMGTRPDVQGQGLGTAVLRAVISTADQQQLPLYIEAADEGLVALFGKHGFTKLGRYRSFTLMVRPVPNK